MEFTQSDALTIEAIKGYTKVGKHEVSAMQSVANKFIDPKAHVCSHCPAQNALNPQLEVSVEAPKKRGRKPKTEE